MQLCFIFWRHKHTYILGDNAINKEYLNLISKTGFVFFINIYTKARVGFNQSRLNYIFINSNDQLINMENTGVFVYYKHISPIIIQLVCL